MNNFHNLLRTDRELTRSVSDLVTRFVRNLDVTFFIHLYASSKMQLRWKKLNNLHIKFQGKKEICIFFK